MQAGMVVKGDSSSDGLRRLVRYLTWVVAAHYLRERLWRIGWVYENVCGRLKPSRSLPSSLALVLGT